MSIYSLVVKCINNKNIGDNITRQELISYVSYETSSIDVYRRKLTLLGFLSSDGNGIYIKKKNIPSFIKSSMIINKKFNKKIIDRLIKIKKITKQLKN